ncbi:uncharacterized protein PV09_00848 [Verruconis gallopava]|uniref:Transmembrane protein n=1 Tax=Verruconis gallopava TaxID=253628 RepID=A0A0D1Z7J9_9PEZI|nr:uncharacterized protein PV09_00848 [Verruconis gallopava]KIW08932.1 hypothetical protein PV09_00848 [Verruconis gallopava]
MLFTPSCATLALWTPSRICLDDQEKWSCLCPSSLVVHHIFFLSPSACLESLFFFSFLFSFLVFLFFFLKKKKKNLSSFFSSPSSASSSSLTCSFALTFPLFRCTRPTRGFSRHLSLAGRMVPRLYRPSLVPPPPNSKFLLQGALASGPCQ